jgi:hypothetical protein
VSLVQGTKYAAADKQQLSALFNYLDVCLEQVVKDNELGALKQALKVLAPRSPSLDTVYTSCNPPRGVAQIGAAKRRHSMGISASVCASMGAAVSNCLNDLLLLHCVAA